jgi:hypothetical protein
MFISSIGIMASHLASSVCMAAILAVDSATKLKKKSVKQLLGDLAFEETELFSYRNKLLNYLCVPYRTFQLELLQMTDDIFFKMYGLDPTQTIIFSDQTLVTQW